MEVKYFLGFRLIVLLVFVALFAPAFSTHGEKQLHELYSWKSLDFQYPNESARNYALESKSFIPGNALPMDVSFYEGDGRNRVFVTMPRYKHVGVPVTIGYVTDKKNSVGDPIIAPYPNMQIQDIHNDCSGLKSVWRIAIDSCDRMWILDSGKIGTNQVCPPKLLVYSLHDDSLLSTYVLPNDQFVATSLFVTPIVDIRGSNGCDDAFVYMADATGFGIIVYDHRNSRSWRIVNKLFYPIPRYGTFTINGESFDLMGGIIAMALSPVQRNGDRTLFFHSLASHTESWVSTSIIRNRTTFEHSSESSLRSFKAYPHQRTSQSAAEVMNKDGILFFGLVSEVALACWNSKTDYCGRNIERIVVDRKTLQFPSGMKIVERNGREELWIITNSFQKSMTGSISEKETNFRIQVAYVDELIRDTNCEVPIDYNDIPHRKNIYIRFK